MSEIEALTKRMSALEQEVEGEKLVSRHILEQTRRNGDDVAAIRTQLSRMEQRQDRTEFEIRALRTELPRLVVDAVREGLRDPDR
jgi:hypothetical protein